MNRYMMAACWAIAMLILASLAKVGWIDRDTAKTMLLIMPILAFVTISGRGGCRLTAREA